MLKVVGNEAAQDEVDGRSLLDEIAREGARRMVVAALETEVAAYLGAYREERDEDGHALVVRNGKGRTRKVTVGAGTIPVSAPRVNDRRTDQDGERRRFTSRILPTHMRRSPKVAEVLPVLYLRGLSNRRLPPGARGIARGRCRDWFPKLGNLLDKLPKRLQPRVKAALHEVMYAEPREHAREAVMRFATECGPKYPKAVTTLEKDADVLLTFFDFPAEHWEHLRTSNVIESPFATVRLRQRVTKGRAHARWVC